MPIISSYTLQYGSLVGGVRVPFTNADFTTLSNSSFNLIITDAAPLNLINSALTTSQLTQLQGQGRIVVGYVDIAVTDDNRTYWNDNWTNIHTLGLRDTGVPAADAPAWLRNGVVNAFGRIADIGNPTTQVLDAGWLDIVIAQAVELVKPIAQGGRGYDGIFLDDVAAYFRLGDAKNGTAGVHDYANFMARLVHEVVSAVRAVKQNAYIVANANPYLVLGDATNSTLITDYLMDVDAQLLENPALATVNVATNVFANETILLLSSNGITPILSNAAAALSGIISSTTASNESPAPSIAASTAGNDTLIGGDGADNLEGLGGSDRIDGGGGIDTASYGLSAGSIYADIAAGYVLETGRQTGTVTGAEALLSTDRLFSIESLNGSAYGDRIYGTNAANVLNGGAGDDIIYAEGGDDVVISGAGSDILLGGSGSDTLDYSDAAGAVFASLDGYAIETGLQSGTVSAGTAALSTDLLAQFENLTGSAFGDRLYGDAAANRLTGNGGDDFLYGGGGADTLIGGDGLDRLIGEAGADTLTGGAGADRFIFSTAPGSGVDVITDFNKTEVDQLLFLRSAFGLAPADPLVLVVNGAAVAAHSFLYNSSTGLLSYDADGAGGAAALDVASIGADLALVAGDLVLYG